MPIKINLLFVVLASFVSIFVAKILFGGEGKSIVNESALGIALIAGILGGFSTTICSYMIEGETIISPLEYFAKGDYGSIPALSKYTLRFAWV